MTTIPFAKMQGTGNDFIVIESIRYRVSGIKFIQRICDRIYGIGADGVLFLDKSKKADVRMRIFNADGSEAEMCGNGARCAALYTSRKSQGTSHKAQVTRHKLKIKLETKAGILDAYVQGDNVKIRMTDPLDLRLGMSVRVDGKDHEVDYINTGVPHAVIVVDDVGRVPVRDLGRAIRHHEVFQPAGTNVDFIEIRDKGHILARTYERGVEDETLACGTGSVASAIVAFLNTSGETLSRPGKEHKVLVRTRGKETLAVYFRASKKSISDVWLEGKARIVYRGEYYV